MVVKTAVYSDLSARNRPSFFATPIAWAAASFTQQLIASEGGVVPDHTGLVVISDECSLATIRDLSRTAARGMISPLRFAGASPSILAGLPALQHAIRGPSLALTMPPDQASSAIVAVISYWLQCCNIVAAIAIAHYEQGEHHHLFKGLIARSAGDALKRQVLHLSNTQPGDEV